MTRIKLRYGYEYCNQLGIKVNDIRDCEGLHFTGHCSYGGTFIPEEREVKVINPCCKYFEYKYGEFEKECKRYSYDNGILRISGHTYYEYQIDYLEIDGRVLIDKTSESK